MNLCMPVSAVRENPNAEIIPRAAKYLMGLLLTHSRPKAKQDLLFITTTATVKSYSHDSMKTLP